MDHEIIQDLLPLYHDGVCSEKSRAAVAAHLADCSVCREALAAMDSPLPAEKTVAADDKAAMEKIAREWNRGRWKARIKAAAVTAAVCLVLFGAWMAATELFLFPVDPAKMEITEVRQLRDGRILYHFYIDDDLGLRLTRFVYDEDGNMYYVPTRALITEKRWEGNSPANMEKVLDLEWDASCAEERGVEELVRVWYGQGEDAILLWEEGMELPPASEEDEAVYGFSEESARYWAERK